ncbi:ankyrin repeat domain-containing protein [Thalassiella azotivora]
MPVELDEETLAYAHRVLDLARHGAAAELAAELDAGLPANLTNDRGDTLLLLGAYHKHPDVVRTLLDHGADHGRVNDRGQTALGAAVFRQDARTVRMLLDAGADPHAGNPSATAVARFFDLPAMAGLLEGLLEGLPEEQPGERPDGQHVGR